jgi:hypothetical protein
MEYSSGMAPFASGGEAGKKGLFSFLAPFFLAWMGQLTISSYFFRRPQSTGDLLDRN